MSPQHGQAVGAGTTTRTRSSWAGKGWREGFPTFCRGRHRGLGGGLLGRERVGGRRGFELLELQLVLVEEALGPLGALAVESSGELGDLEPEVGDQRGIARQLGLHGGGLGLGALDGGLSLIGPKGGLVGQANGLIGSAGSLIGSAGSLIGPTGGLIGPKLGSREGRAQRFHVDDFGFGALRHEESGSQLGVVRHGCRSRSCV